MIICLAMTLSTRVTSRANSGQSRLSDLSQSESAAEMTRAIVKQTRKPTLEPLGSVTTYSGRPPMRVDIALEGRQL